MQERYSCRTFDPKPLSPEDLSFLEAAIARQAGQASPFAPAGSTRLVVVAAREGDAAALRGLGTYGFIKQPQAFLVAAIQSDAGLEDSGWQLEHLVLACQARGIHSCWLGGSFRRSRFEQAVSSATGLDDFSIPAVIALGYPAAGRDPRNSFIRRTIGGFRKPWPELFFTPPAKPLAGPEAAGPWAQALEMLRLAPSASNKQPWRVLLDPAGRTCHLLLVRTPGYGQGIAARLVKTADIQRVDMGIAACHLDLAARSGGLPGRWEKLASGEEALRAWQAAGPADPAAASAGYVLSFRHEPAD